MTSQPIELEGTWEEIVAHATELAGRRVRVIIMPDKAESSSPEAPQPFRPPSGRSLLRHAGTWTGDDFDECLQLVYDTRSEIEF
ncbi:hypothetical protein H6F98_09570 [Microcoleus sp. FACHB-SPT15]|uniref:hypothetical protein n=1 Tax=Microcoleus sp. FACHB-SPT15 TaxID=2692830 RepID=UPI00177F35BC|nr:hypothetical protein [Microcoleus sp. FACHB-SPT15]MBD1805697.1 hypothetical protein [Microcoleus sp. FACHB-SPT15]